MPDRRIHRILLIAAWVVFQIAADPVHAYWQSFTNSDFARSTFWSDHFLWVATTGALLGFDTDGNASARYFTGDGLSDPNLYSVEAAGTGQLWIGSAGGLDLFTHGNTLSKSDDEWLHFNHTSGITSQLPVTHIRRESPSLIWLVTPDWLVRFDTQGTPTNSADDVWTVHEYQADYKAFDIASDGTKWFLHQEANWSVLYQLDDNGTPAKEDDELVLVREHLAFWPLSLHIDVFENKWLVFDQGFAVFNDRGTPADSTDDDFVEFYAQDGLVDRHIQSVNGRDGFIWVSTTNGLYVLDYNATPYDKSDDVWTRFDTTYGLANNNVKDTYISDAAHVWIATGNGASQLCHAGTPRELDDDQWKTYHNSDDMHLTDVHNVFIAPDQTKWFANDFTSPPSLTRFGDGATISRDDDQWTHYHRDTDDILYQRVYDITYDEYGDAWFATYLHLSRLSDGGTPFAKEDDSWYNYYYAGFAGQLAAALCEGNQGTWFGTLFSGLGYMDTKGTYDPTDDESVEYLIDGEPYNGANCVAGDYSGAKWWGIQGINWSGGAGPICLGVRRLDDSGTPLYPDDDTWTSYKASQDGLASDCVACIYEGDAGELWFGSGYRKSLSSGHNYIRLGNGISRVEHGGNATKDDDVIAAYRVEDGLCDNSVLDIDADASGSLWLATWGGVGYFDHAGTAQKDDDQWLCFRKEDGLLSNTVNGVAVDGNGSVWFGTVQGLNRYVKNFTSIGIETAVGGVEVTWAPNPTVDIAASVNLYRSTSYEDNYSKLNLSSLPLSGSYLDADPAPGVTNYYWLELVLEDGTTSRDKTDRVWVEPPAVLADFVVTVRESTVAAPEGGTSTFDVEVLSQKRYSGTVTLGVSGLGSAAESFAFDPPTVEVPGHSALTVAWDPLADAPVGSPIEDGFQITATEVTGTAASTKTVDVLGVVIDPADEYLTQFVYPAEPTAGHETEVFGRLTPQAAGQTVTVTTGTTLDVFTATTDESGFFSTTVPVAAAGSIAFASSTSGASTAPYQTEASRGRRHIRMTATTADGQFDPSDLVTVDGEIDPGLGEGEIYLALRNPDDTYAFKGHVSVDEYGTFHQSFYAQEGVTEVEAELAGDEDYYNASARLNVPVNAPIGMAIVVAGGGETGNPLWAATGVLTDRSYNVYKGRLIPEERIRYLHPDASRDPDGDGTPEVSATPTKANLQSSIETWASSLVDASTTYAPFKTPLTIYVVGVEVSPGVIQLNETETLSATELGGYLDTFLSTVQARYTDPEVPAPSSVPVNVVLEFEESGAFVDELAARNRIVVTSTGDGSGFPGINIISPDGTLAFSRYFYDEIDQGKYVATGWATGAEQMLYESLYSQWPLIESNGNGIPNEETDQLNGDGAGDKVLEYRDTYERRPAIDAMFSGLTIPEGEAEGLLWAKILDYGEYIDRVKCVVLPPEGSGEPMREYRMHWNAAHQRYELNHDGFRHRGLYKILITAVDADEDAALPWLSLVDVRGDTLGEDTTPPEDVTDVYTQARDGSVYLSWTESISIRRGGLLCIHETRRRRIWIRRLRRQRRPLHGHRPDQRRGVSIQDHRDR